MMPQDHVVRAAIAGDSDARDEVGEWLAVELSTFFANRFRDTDKIQDLLQSTMARVWAELARQHAGTADEFRQWCLDVGRRTAMATSRKARRDVARVAKIAAVQVEPSPSPSSTLAAAEKRDLVERCIDRLATPYREALRDKLQGYTARSVAEAKGIPIGTIYSRRREAQAQLEELIAHERRTPVAYRERSL